MLPEIWRHANSLTRTRCARAGGRSWSGRALASQCERKRKRNAQRVRRCHGVDSVRFSARYANSQGRFGTLESTTGSPVGARRRRRRCCRRRETRSGRDRRRGRWTSTRKGGPNLNRRRRSPIILEARQIKARRRGGRTRIRHLCARTNAGAPTSSRDDARRSAGLWIGADVEGAGRRKGGGHVRSSNKIARRQRRLRFVVTIRVGCRGLSHPLGERASDRPRLRSRGRNRTPTPSWAFAREPHRRRSREERSVSLFGGISTRCRRRASDGQSARSTRDFRFIGASLTCGAPPKERRRAVVDRVEEALSHRDRSWHEPLHQTSATIARAPLPFAFQEWPHHR